MRINTVLQKKYPDSSDMYSKIESTKVCMLYNELVQTTFAELKASEAVSMQYGSLAVVVNSHYEAQNIKLYEFDIIKSLNQTIINVKFQVIAISSNVIAFRKLNIRSGSNRYWDVVKKRRKVLLASDIGFIILTPTKKKTIGTTVNTRAVGNNRGP